MSANLAPPGAIENEPREKLDVEEILHPQEKPDTEKTYEFQDLLIGAVLRKLRGSMSLREVERQTGIANPYLSSLELGAKRPGFKVLIQLALFYGVHVNYLLELAGLRNPRAPGPSEEEAEDIERSYRFILDDPRLRACPRPQSDLPIDAKRFLVQAYERLTGKALL